LINFTNILFTLPFQRPLTKLIFIFLKQLSRYLSYPFYVVQIFRSCVNLFRQLFFRSLHPLQYISLFPVALFLFNVALYFFNVILFLFVNKINLILVFYFQWYHIIFLFNYLVLLFFGCLNLLDFPNFFTKICTPHLHDEATRRTSFVLFEIRLF